ncbi:MAG: hypothetical protein JXQ90_15745 [Cyclobacteriaceae bacterium]
MRIRNYHLIPLLALALGFLMGCGGTSTTEDKKSSEQDLFEKSQAKIIADIAKIASELPPPSLIPNTIEEIGARYNPQLINDLSSLESYLVNDDLAALNLGIYATDITYTASYDKVAETEEHMEACKQLAEALGVSTAFDLNMLERYESVHNNHDSLNALLNESVRIVEERLEHSERLAMSALVITGSFIEGLYLAIKVVEQYPHNQITEEERDKLLEPLVRLVLEQEQTLIDIIQMLRDIPQDDMISHYMTELSILKRLYDSDLADMEEKLNTKAEGFVLTADMLLDVNIEVGRIRNEITK